MQGQRGLCDLPGMVDLLPDGLAGDGFAFRDGIALGLTPGTLRSAAYRAPFDGARTLEDPTTLLTRSSAFVPLLQPWQALSGLSALAQLGLPVPWRMSRGDGVEVLSDRRRGRPQRNGVDVTRIAPERMDVRDVAGAPVAAPALAWALMASRCTLHELVVLGDAIVSDAENYPNRRLRGPLASLDELAAISAGWTERAGAATLRAALPRIRLGVESPRETDMRLFIVGAGMPEPEVQVKVYDPADGRFLGRADLMHRHARVVEEYEGEGHRAKGQWDRDIQKHRDFQRIGLHVVRATNRDFVPSPDRWLKDLAAVLRTRTR